MKHSHARQGFTLIELIIVVIVIGILATVAVPQYLKAVERAKGGKARHALGVIAQAEKMYRAENDTYIAAAAGGLNAAMGSFVEMADIDGDNDWACIVGAATASTFTATCTRAAGTPNAGETITLNESGTWGGTFTP